MERKASIREMKRTATWINKGGLTLRGTLKDARALSAFQDFAASVHCEENIVFWVAVEFFRARHCATPNSSDRMRKRLSMTLQMGEDFEPTGAFQGARNEPGSATGKRPAAIDGELLRMFDGLMLMEMPESELLLLTDAVRICKTFIEDEAKHWVSLNSDTVDEIRARILKADVDINIFARAQRSAYDSLKRDLFPRFVQAVHNNPQKYSSQDRFELPDISITILDDEAVQL